MSRPKTFRGRNIILVTLKQYPSCYWPEHPTANKAGLIYIHRVIAYECWGDAVTDMHVHHVDGDVWNWKPKNLELLTSSRHAAHHNTSIDPPIYVPCSVCAKAVRVYRAKLGRVKTTSCSDLCRSRAQERIAWPNNDYLIQKIYLYGFEALSRVLGVSSNAIRKRLRRDRSIVSDASGF